MSTAGKTMPFRILSLSGGGYLGLYSVTILEELEAQVGEPLGRRFDLIAGTSVGSVLALALAFEIPMSTLKTLFLQRGREIFPFKGALGVTVNRVLDMARSMLGPKYTGDALRSMLDGYFGNTALEQALHNLVIPAVNISTGRTKVFKTPHGKLSMGDAHFPVVEVAMASCAAPGYFPSVRIGDHLYADGGVYATAPDLIGYHEAEHYLGVRRTSIRMLSVGTAIAGYVPREELPESASAIAWLSEGRLVLTLASMQQQHVRAVMQNTLGTNYLRLDAAWNASAGLGLDVVTEDASSILMHLARDTLHHTDRRRLNRLLG